VGVRFILGLFFVLASASVVFAEECTDNPISCFDGEVCYVNASTRSATSLACGFEYVCHNGEWVSVSSTSACNECGEYVSSISQCCGDKRVFTFTEGVCFEGRVYRCEADSGCASAFGATCVQNDTDCSGALLNISLEKSVFEDDATIDIDVRLVNFESATFFEVYYGLYDESNVFILGDSDTKQNVSGVVDYTKSIKLRDILPGSYTIRVETEFGGKIYSAREPIIISGDCVEIDGPNQMPATRDSSQDIFFSINNTCLIPLHNVTLTFRSASHLFGNVSTNASVRLLNVSLGSSSRNERVRVIYDEGQSQELISIVMQGQANITKSLGRLINSSNVVREKAANILKYAYLGNRGEMKQEYAYAVALLNQSIDEFSLGNYGLSQLFATTSATRFVSIRSRAEESVLMEISIGVGLVGLFLLIFILKLRSFYNR